MNNNDFFKRYDDENKNNFLSQFNLKFKNTHNDEILKHHEFFINYRQNGENPWES